MMGTLQTDERVTDIVMLLSTCQYREL